MKVKLLRKLHKRIRWEYNRENNVWIIYSRDEVAPYSIDPRKEKLISINWKVVRGSVSDYLIHNYTKFSKMIPINHQNKYKRQNQRFIKNNF